MSAGVPGHRGQSKQVVIEATPRQIAREAAKLVRTGIGHVQSVTVAPETNSGRVLMRCDYSLRINSSRTANMKQRGYAEKSFARCSMAPAFKQQLSGRKRKKKR